MAFYASVKSCEWERKGLDEKIDEEEVPDDDVPDTDSLELLLQCDAGWSKILVLLTLARRVCGEFEGRVEDCTAFGTKHCRKGVGLKS